jgi:hypothetical protein
MFVYVRSTQIFNMRMMEEFRCTLAINDTDSNAYLIRNVVFMLHVKDHLNHIYIRRANNGVHHTLSFTCEAKNRIVNLMENRGRLSFIRPHRISVSFYVRMDQNGEKPKQVSNQLTILH